MRRELAAEPIERLLHGNLGQQADALPAAVARPLGQHARAVAQLVVVQGREVADGDRVDRGAGLFHFGHHLLVVAVGEVAPVRDDRDDDRARGLPPLEAAGDLVERVHQRGAGARARPQEADGVPQQLGVRRVVGEDRRAIGQADDRDLVARGHVRDERAQRFANAGNQRLRGGAVVDQDGDVDRLDRAGDAEHLARGAILADDEVVRAETFNRLALLVDRADEHRPLARRLRADGLAHDRRTRQCDPQSHKKGPTRAERCAH